MQNWNRLYAILKENFDIHNAWTIDAMKLKQKMDMTEKYPSVVVRRIESAVNKINRETSLNIALDVRRPRNGKALITFQKK